MPIAPGPDVSRRAFLAGAAGLVASGLLTHRSAGAALREVALAPGRSTVALAGAGHPTTEVWAYGGQVPGPEIRVRRGDRLRVRVTNALRQATSVHWHGIRLPNAMDGVPGLTQDFIAPGETFVYEFDCMDAGTFWYHPHWRSHEQVGRGLAGALIVEEDAPVDVDRDVVWMLSDWRLLRDGSISNDFGTFHDIAHAGRIGNTVTVNGMVRDGFAVRAGERLRLRLVNVANARIFGLTFEGHAPVVVALDGHPVEPHAPEDGLVVLGPGQRVDLIVDMAGAPGHRFRVIDRYYRDPYRLIDLVYSEGEPLRGRPSAKGIVLPANPVAEPDLAHAVRHDIVLAGGMIGMMGGGRGGPMGMGAMMRQGLAWTINGVAMADHAHDPAFRLARDASVILSLANDTAWPHPMHLHGHVFRVLSIDGRPRRHREWRDTILLEPRARAEIAFRADNPGDWMLHCHVLEHQAGGMMTVLRVA